MTALNRLIGFGLTLGCDPTGGMSFTQLASIVGPPSGPNAKTDKVDVSILSDKVKQFRGAQIDPGEYTFEIAYSPDDATTTTLVTLLNNSNVANWQITYPSGTVLNESFLGYVSGFDRKIATAERVGATVAITATGSTGLTA